LQTQRDATAEKISSIFIVGVSRKKNWDEFAGVFTQVKVWLKIA
jgi:hypothetical protein